MEFAGMPSVDHYTDIQVPGIAFNGFFFCSIYYPPPESNLGRCVKPPRAKTLYLWLHPANCFLIDFNCYTSDRATIEHTAWFANPVIPIVLYLRELSDRDESILLDVADDWLSLLCLRVWLSAIIKEKDRILIVV